MAIAKLIFKWKNFTFKIFPFFFFSCQDRAILFNEHLLLTFLEFSTLDRTLDSLWSFSMILYILIGNWNWPLRAAITAASLCMSGPLSCSAGIQPHHPLWWLHGPLTQETCSAPEKEDVSGITQHETQHRTHLFCSTQYAEMSASVSCCSSSEKMWVTFFDALEREHKVGGNSSGNPKT